MASAFTHALMAIAIGKTYSKKYTALKFFILGAACAIIPDADVVMFRLGIPYEHMFGHRGFSHSIVFAILLGFLVTLIFYKKINLFSPRGLLYSLFFFLCTVSHPVLDAMTTGGLGVAFFSPFDNTRYFFPWRPIEVSPIGVGRFMSKWGLRVIKSELLWVGIPCMTYILICNFIRQTRNRKG